jgi:L-seryl-tRNA(Ser) seleniumtransferase
MTIARLPQVDRILRHPRVLDAQSHMRRDLVADLVRAELDRLRAAQGLKEEDLGIDAIAESIAAKVNSLLRPSLQKVINATGVVLNTNLGRAPLSPSAVKYLQSFSDGYCNLEIDLVTGKRGKRSERINALLRLITGAEAAIAVNNNAAAVVLAVNAFAKNREVVVSRGELIEIGGSFRLPDVIESAGGILREVGTTNRTRAGDFRKAINEKTGLLMRCHRSNFEITGFTEVVSLQELVSLSKEMEVPVLEDLGSGVLFDLGAAGVKDEPTVREVVASGCDMISFSGDKLLGGPQAGIIVGSKSAIERLSKHPLYRALRLDKLTLSLLEQTLISYLRPEPEKELPVLSMIMMDASDIKTRAEKFAATVGGGTHSSKIKCFPIKTNAAAGGGSLPGESIESWGVVVNIGSLKPARLMEKLRASDPPIIAIVQEDQVILDFRTLSDQDEKLLIEALGKIADSL